MDEDKTINHNGTLKVIVAILLVLGTVISSVYALVGPMNQRIDFLEIQILNMENRVVDSLQQHTSENDHPWGVITEIGKVQEKFIEVETQFNGMERRIVPCEDWIKRYLITTPPTDAAQNERLRALERIIFQDHPTLLYKTPSKGE